MALSLYLTRFHLKGYSLPCFYDDAITKHKKLKPDTSKRITTVKKLYCKSYNNLATISQIGFLGYKYRQSTDRTNKSNQQLNQ